MTDWKPSSGPDSARRRADMLRRLRTHFELTTTLEVDTPALSRYAVSDTQIETLEVLSSLTIAPLYLHTSPEFCMKRLLAAGYPDIFSICRVFRDGECGCNHMPEFTLVEWYRLAMNLDEIVADTIATIAAALGQPPLIDTYYTLNYRDAFLDVINLDPVHATVDQLADASDADPGLRASIGAERDDWLDLILSTIIAPTFSKDVLTVLQHYPSTQAALARRCPSDASVADRFEVFIGSSELANGYVELADVNEQSERIAKDQANRKNRSRTVRPIDQQLLAALEAGLPASAGVAMGLERLQMTLDKTCDIRDVVTFAFEDRHE